jgi:protein ImuB
MLQSRLAIALWLPTFELRLELLRAPELESSPVALLAPGEPSGRARIHQLSEAAGVAGVQPGMTVSQAVALCPGLTLLESDPEHYASATLAMLEALGNLSPVVESGEPGEVFVGGDGLERLLGGPEAQVHALLRLLLTLFPPPLAAAFRVGYAPGVFGARVAARAAQPGVPVLIDSHDPEALGRFLAFQPLQALPLHSQELERLERLGLRTLGEVGRLPLPDLLRHFGVRARELQALAQGNRIDPVRARHRPTPLRVRMDLSTPLGEHDAIRNAMNRLVDRLLVHPERKARALGRLRMGGRLDGGGSWRVEVPLRTPSAQRERLAFALWHRFLLHPPLRALESLFLEALDFGLPETQTELFRAQEAGARDHHGEALRGGGGGLPLPILQALRELRLRVGGDPLYRVVEVDPWSRIPERRYALLPLEG